MATLPDLVEAGANCIFPMEPAQCYTVQNYEEFEYLMVRPADRPIYIDGGKTVVINLKPWK